MIEPGRRCGALSVYVFQRRELERGGIDSKRLRPLQSEIPAKLSTLKVRAGLAESWLSMRQKNPRWALALAQLGQSINKSHWSNRSLWLLIEAQHPSLERATGARQTLLVEARTKDDVRIV